MKSCTIVFDERYFSGADVHCRHETNVQQLLPLQRHRDAVLLSRLSTERAVQSPGENTFP